MSRARSPIRRKIDQPSETKVEIHSLWDYDAVNALFPQVIGRLPKSKIQAQIEPLKREVVHEMATHEPKNWRMPSNIAVDNYAEMWADEILPMAREAHTR